MAIKRKSKKSSGWKKWKKNIPRPAKKRTAPKKFATKVMAVVNRKAEVKKQMVLIVANTAVYHNNILNLHTNAFRTLVGSAGDNIQYGGPGTRLGNKIFLKGIRVALNIEAQQYRPLTHWTLMLIRNKKQADLALTAKDQIFEGVSTTIPCDYIDPTKVDVMFSKRFTLRMPNSGTTVAMSQSADGTGFNGGAYEYAAAPPLGEDKSYHVFTNPQYNGKFYIPINKQISYLDYGDGATLGLPVASQHYQWIVTGYDNFTTHTGPPTIGVGYPLGNLTMSCQLIFTDV